MRIVGDTEPPRPIDRFADTDSRPDGQIASVDRPVIGGPPQSHRGPFVEQIDAVVVRGDPERGAQLARTGPEIPFPFRRRMRWPV